MWFVVLCSISPWLAGGMAISLVFANSQQKPRYLALCFGVGGLLGTIGTALLTIMATWVGISLLAPQALFVLGLVFVASALRFVQIMPKRSASHGKVPQLGVIAIASFASVVVIAGINGWQVLWVPTTGWDTLWSWAEISQEFISTTQVRPTPSWVHDQTHPSTVAIIGAWTGAHIPSAGGVGPVYLSWWLAWVSILLIVYGYTEAVTKNTNASALATVVSASIPLLTNHVILGGYAEIFLAASVAGGTALLTLSLKEQNKRLALLGLMLALSCITLKNIGLIFGGCIVLSYVACFSINRGFGTQFIGLTAITVIGVGVLVITAGEQPFSFEIGSRQLTLQLSNAPIIFRNELISLFCNASFSIAALLLIAPILVLRNTSGRCKHMEITSLMPWLTSLLLLGILCASQLTDYGFLYAVPGNDTGNSRLSLPLIVFTLLIIGPLWTSASTTRLKHN